MFGFSAKEKLDRAFKKPMQAGFTKFVDLTTSFVAATVKTQHYADHVNTLERALYVMGCLSDNPHETTAAALRIWGGRTSEYGNYCNSLFDKCIEGDTEKLVATTPPLQVITQYTDRAESASDYPTQVMLIRGACRALAHINEATPEAIKIVEKLVEWRTLMKEHPQTPALETALTDIERRTSGFLFMSPQMTINTLGPDKAYALFKNMAAENSALKRWPKQRAAAESIKLYSKQLPTIQYADEAIKMIDDLLLFRKGVSLESTNDLATAIHSTATLLLPLIAKKQGSEKAYYHAARLQADFPGPDHESPVTDYMAQNLKQLTQEKGIALAADFARLVGRTHPDVIAFTSEHLPDIFYQVTARTRSDLLSALPAGSPLVTAFCESLPANYKTQAQKIFAPAKVKLKRTGCITPEI